MDENVGSSLPDDILDQLFAYAKTTSLADALEVLVKTSRNADGRADLAARSVFALVLDLIQGHSQYLTELLDTFIEKNGVGINLTVLRALMHTPAELCGDPGLSLVLEIARTASIKEWFKLLFSVICLEEAHLPTLFIKLVVASADDSKKVYKWVAGLLIFPGEGKLGVPTGSSPSDVLGHTPYPTGALLPQGLLDSILNLLRELEPPAIIRKTINQGQHQGNAATETMPLQKVLERHCCSHCTGLS
ncbi:hypothetical protein ACJRO7_034413 [Eucalyptus globulus]|uniref:Uncharacterized protein n=1 Tax=Eucalyptus globulus TaxID=34317 RepID=A0ABD3J380_EUCGL